MSEDKETLQPKLTDWENEPTVNVLKEDLLKARSSQSSWISNIERWRSLNEVSGFAKPKGKNGRSSVQPRLIRRQAEWRYSALTEPFLSSNKIFSVYPRTFEDFDAAKQNELLLNYQFQTKLNKVKFIDELVRTVVDEGTGIVRLGWDRQTQQVEETVPVYSYYPLQDPAALEQFQQAVMLESQNPREFKERVPEEVQAAVQYFKETQQPTQAVPVGLTQVSRERLIENRPTLDILCPENVFIDPSCNGDLDKALFVIVSFETNKADLLKAGLYSNLDLVNWEGAASPLDDGEHSSSTPDDFNFSDSFRKKVVAYEYWGFYDVFGNSTLTPFVATWIGDVMIRMELNPFPDGKLPFVVIPYLPLKRSLYGEPDAALLEDDQMIVGALTRGMIDLLGGSANSQQGFAKGMLDATNKRRFLQGEDYEFNPQIPVQQGYIQHVFPEIPASAINLLMMINQDAESLTGVKAFTGGISGDSYGQVVAGIRGALDASAKREMAILRRLAKGVSEIGSKIVAMNAAFMSEEEVVRVTNRNYVTIRKEDIKGSFDLEVEINTAEIDNMKAQDLAFMLQTIGPKLDTRITLQMIAEIAELKRMPHLAEQIRAYQPQPDPLDQAMKQAEIRKTESEAVLNQAKAQEAQASSQTRAADAQIRAMETQSKIGINQAKIAESQAKTAAAQLNTELDVTGIKHRRDMEKVQAQAEALQDLEITKAMLKPAKHDEVEPDYDAAYGFNLLSRNR